MIELLRADRKVYGKHTLPLRWAEQHPRIQNPSAKGLQQQQRTGIRVYIALTGLMKILKMGEGLKKKVT